MKGLTRWGLVMGGFLLILVSVFVTSPTGGASSLLWGLLSGAVLALLTGATGFILFVTRHLWTKKAHKEEKGVASEKSASPPFWGPLADALASWSTIIFTTLLIGITWIIGHSLIEESNITWIPLFFWILYIFFAEAREISKKFSKEKEKKPNESLSTCAKATKIAAVIASFLTIVYFVQAPQGEWLKTAGKSGGIVTAFSPVEYIPAGIPRNPQFTATQLENWTVTYVSSNPSYNRSKDGCKSDLTQSCWNGKALGLAKEPGRYIMGTVELTATFGKGHENLDIHLSGSCTAIMQSASDISKKCAGTWEDRGGRISGEFCLAVREAGTGRYFDVELYDGNHLPRNCLKGYKIGTVIPHASLQFRPREWKEEN